MQNYTNSGATPTGNTAIITHHRGADAPATGYLISATKFTDVRPTSLGLCYFGGSKYYPILSQSGFTFTDGTAGVLKIRITGGFRFWIMPAFATEDLTSVFTVTFTNT